MRKKLASLLFCLGWCVPGFAQDATLPERVQKVFIDRCMHCHPGDGEGPLEWFDLTNPAQLMAPPKKDYSPLIVAGKPEESKLWKIIRDQESARRMPKLPSKALSKSELEDIDNWIKKGALPAKAAVPERRKFVSLEDSLKAMCDYMDSVDPDDWPNIRFFTLTHLHNDEPKHISDQYLALVRAALAKTLNSLSWKARFVEVTPVDVEKTIYAIDLRDLDWDRTDFWYQIEKQYPYGLDHAEAPGTLGKWGRKLKDKFEPKNEGQSVVFHPIVRADWFVSEATRPPLYHTLLNLPNTAGELEARLKVNVYENFRRNRLARAGFQTSRVSQQNRMIERHDSVHGAYWKSYDFGPSNTRANLNDFPLGPVFPKLARHKWAGQEFRHDGGEIVFHLPNGLQGYMLVNGEDKIISIGPTEVVRDKDERTGSVAIINGVSCIACHVHGMFPPPADEVQRDRSTALEGKFKTKVERLYIDNKQMEALIAEDEGRFLRALEKVIVPYLKPYYPSAKEIKDYPEPVAEVVKRYKVAPLRGSSVAAELWCKDYQTLFDAMGKQGLGQYGLGALPNGRSVGRETIEFRFQEAAMKLDLGEPRNTPGRKSR